VQKTQVAVWYGSHWQIMAQCPGSNFYSYVKFLDEKVVTCSVVRVRVGLTRLLFWAYSLLC